MIKLLGKILFALIWDEKAAKRWIRGIVGVMATCGAAFGDQLFALDAPHGLVKCFKIACVVAAFAVAAHGDPLKPRSKLKALEPPL